MRGARAKRRWAEMERLDDAEHLRHGDAAGGGRAHAANLMRAIGNADRLALDGAIARQILSGELAGLARIALHGAGDVFGDVARVEGRGSVAGNRLECVGQRGIGQLVAGREGPALRVEEIGARVRREALRVGLRDQLGEAGRDGETFAGKRDGGLKQFRPRQLAVLVVGELQRGERAGHADRKTARHGRVARQRLAVRIEEELGRGGGGRGLAAVDACELLGASVPIENVAAAADAR